MDKNEVFEEFVKKVKDEGYDLLSVSTSSDTTTGQVTYEFTIPALETSEALINRLIKEREELDLKIDKLNCFIDSGRAVSIRQKNLLSLQQSVMEIYSRTLQERINDLSNMFREMNNRNRI